MEILGYEISLNRKQTHKGSVVTVPKPDIETQPSLPLKSAFPRQEIGDSGTRTMKGVIFNDYNPQLQGIQGIKIWDEMRFGDGTVRAAIMATTLPIRRAEWFVNPATQEQKDVDIGNFVSHALFDWLEDMTWDDVIRQALISVPCGVMLFEKIYTTKEHEGKTWVTLKKLAPRLPQSIQQWELADGTFGIQQIRQDGQNAQIPGSKLLIFCNEREGDNWWGTPYLRAAYKHWYYKNNFYKIDAVAFERQGLGVPMIKMPEGYTESDEKLAAQAAMNIRANAQAFLILPPNYEAEFMDMGSHTTRDPQNSINHHNKEILQSFLAQFLELGQTKTGSRATSQDHSDLFLKGLEAIADNLISVINKDLIPELVDLNFDDVTVYPALDYAGIIKVDIAALGQALAQLVTAKAIHPTIDDEQYIRAAMGLPARTQEQIDEATDDDPSLEEEVDHVDVVATPGGDEEVDEGGDDEEVDDATKKPDAKAQSTSDKKKVDTASKKKPKKASEHVHVVRKLSRIFDDGTGFKSWRPLTMAEQKVDWSGMEDSMDAIQDSFTKKAKTALTAKKDDFMSKLSKALQSGDTKAITALEVGFIVAYKAIVKDALKTSYESGKVSAAREMGIDVPPNTADTLASFDVLAQSIAEKLASDIESRAKIAAANALNHDQSALQVAGKIDADLDGAIDKSLQVTGGTIVGQGINQGRNDVFERNVDQIYALQRSEILDQKTCNYCLSMDGLVFDVTDPITSYTVFHTNCRGIWVQILNDEVNPPAITGLTPGLEDLYGGQINDLDQPKNPIVRQGSPAAKEVARRQAVKKK